MAKDPDIAEKEGEDVGQGAEEGETEGETQGEDGDITEAVEK